MTDTAADHLTYEAFEYIAKSARSKENGYAEMRTLCAAKEVLIKSVLQAKPTQYELFSVIQRSRLLELPNLRSF